VKEGWLEKKGDHVGSWRKRWFLLRGRYLLYTLSPEEDMSRPRGMLPLEGCVLEDATASLLRQKPFAIVLAHPTRQTYYLAAESKQDREAWLAALTAAATGVVEKRVLLEYRGQEISDPEDAKQIAQASVDVQRFAYEQYAAARGDLERALAEREAARSEIDTLTRQKRLLAKEVKALRATLAERQGLFQAAERRVAELQAADRDENRELLELTAAVTDLQRALDKTTPDAISGEQPDALRLSQPELLKRSSAAVNDLARKLPSLANGAFVQLRAVASELLEDSMEMRLKLNHYAEHIFCLTQEKLQSFEKEFERKLEGGGKKKK
jgi:hypothetical protein